MSFNATRVANIKRIRAETGLGLRESSDLYDKFMGDIDGILVRYKRYQENRIVVGEFTSKLAIYAVIVESDKVPELNQLYRGTLTDWMRNEIKARDPEARIRELVDKRDADEMIGMAGA